MRRGVLNIVEDNQKNKEREAEQLQASAVSASDHESWSPAP